MHLASWRRGPGYYLGAYRAQLRAHVAVMLQYRAAVLIWAVWGFVVPLVSLAMWSAAVGSRGAAVTGPSGAQTYDTADFAAYFLTLMVFSHLTMSWDAFEFAWRVRSGHLNAHLLKPIHPIHHDACQNMAFKLTSSAWMLPIWVLLIFLLKPSPPSSPLSLALAVPSLALAAVLRYVIQYCLAIIAFWTTRVEAIQQLFFTIDSFLGGRIAPLALLPAWLGPLALVSPFRWMGAFPVELALGRVPAAEIVPGFLFQLAWLCAAWLLLRLMWAAGVKQYGAVGA